ncbi:hypothetical protein C0J52_15522 [Blattella germanica]|nr:hypothetical protein C0J52_15522 [Blattella germanica]
MYGRKILKKQSSKVRKRNKSKCLVRKTAISRKRKCETETEDRSQNIKKSKLPFFEAEPATLWDLINTELFLEEYHGENHLSMDPTLVSHLKGLRESSLLDEDIQLEHVEVFQTVTMERWLAEHRAFVVETFLRITILRSQPLGKVCTVRTPENIAREHDAVLRSPRQLAVRHASVLGISNCSVCIWTSILTPINSLWCNN